MISWVAPVVPMDMIKDTAVETGQLVLIRFAGSTRIRYPFVGLGVVGTKTETRWVSLLAPSNTETSSPVINPTEYV